MHALLPGNSHHPFLPVMGKARFAVGAATLRLTCSEHRQDYLCHSERRLLPTVCVGTFATINNYEPTIISFIHGSPSGSPLSPALNAGTMGSIGWIEPSARNSMRARQVSLL